MFPLWAAVAVRRCLFPCGLINYRCEPILIANLAALDRELTAALPSRYHFRLQG
jgi:hypothetical protein